MSGSYMVDLNYLKWLIKEVEKLQTDFRSSVAGRLRDQHWEVLEGKRDGGGGHNPFGHFNHAGVAYQAALKSRQDLLAHATSVEQRLEAFRKALVTAEERYRGVDTGSQVALSQQDAQLVALFGSGPGGAGPGATAPGATAGV